MSLLLTQGNAMTIPLADESVHMVCTSPPYWGLRDYGIGDQLGLEPTPEQYVANMVAVFREVRRVLRDDGTCWLNLGDSYATQPAGNKTPSGFQQKSTAGQTGALVQMGNKIKPTFSGLKPKDLCGIPWRVAFALQADGWWLRSDIIWAKPNPMPESVTDRPTKAHEYLFLLTKSARYYYDADAVREEGFRSADGNGLFNRVRETDYKDGREKIKRFKGSPDYSVGRNRRTVWHIATAPYSGAHFATYPPALVEPCIKAGTSERGVCPECGKPWERVTEPTPEYAEYLGKGWNDHTKDNTHGSIKDDTKGARTTKQTTTLGWRPTCEHYPDEMDIEEAARLFPVPATVFDPFCGSATTLQVARALGRNGVGLDLSLEYLHLARQRLELDRLDAWNEGIGISDNAGDNGHKNKQVPGRVTHSFHAARKEKDVTDLPMFEGLR